jgi:hypothetical protein
MITLVGAGTTRAASSVISSQRAALLVLEETVLSLFLLFGRTRPPPVGEHTQRDAIGGYGQAGVQEKAGQISLADRSQPFGSAVQGEIETGCILNGQNDRLILDLFQGGLLLGVIAP